MLSPPELELRLSLAKKLGSGKKRLKNFFGRENFGSEKSFESSRKLESEKARKQEGKIARKQERKKERKKVNK